MGKIDILTRALRGEILKRTATNISTKELEKLSHTPTVPVIVSLTSYGERVSKTVPAVIVSILRQESRPERIVLWLDSSKWNDTNIPDALKRLQPYGLEIGYVKDVRSHTKLVYALSKFPDKTVVTVDDDLYYTPDLITELYTAHKANPGHIVALRYRYPEIDPATGLPTPYNTWKESILDNDSPEYAGRMIFPLGYGGVLYPAGTLHGDVTDDSLFLKLAPYADDIWFYIMGVLKGTPKMALKEHRSTHYFMDLFRQLRTRDRLCDTNVGESRNDRQLRDVLNHYSLKLGRNSVMI